MYLLHLSLQLCDIKNCDKLKNVEHKKLQYL